MGPTWDINKEFSFTKSPSPASKAPSSLGASYAGLGVRRRPCLLSVRHTKRPQMYFPEQFGVYGSLQEYLFQVRFSRTYSADGRQLSRSSLGPRKWAPSSTSTGREGRKGTVPSPSEKRFPVGRLRFREWSNVLCPLTWQRNNVKRSDFNACHFFNNTLLWTFKAFYFFFFFFWSMREKYRPGQSPRAVTYTVNLPLYRGTSPSTSWPWTWTTCCICSPACCTRGASSSPPANWVPWVLHTPFKWAVLSISQKDPPTSAGLEMARVYSEDNISVSDIWF